MNYNSLNPERVEAAKRFVLSCFCNENNPCHWMTIQGFMAVTQPPFSKLEIMRALSLLYERGKSFKYTYSFLHDGGRSTFMAYIPLLKKKYWQKIYDIKFNLQYPASIRIQYSGNVSSDHVYELLLNKPLIPSLKELVQCYHDFQLGADLPFDYAYWYDRVPNKKEFNKAIVYYYKFRERDLQKNAKKKKAKI